MCLNNISYLLNKMVCILLEYGTRAEMTRANTVELNELLHIKKYRLMLILEMCSAKIKDAANKLVKDIFFVAQPNKPLAPLNKQFLTYIETQHIAFNTLVEQEIANRQAKLEVLVALMLALERQHNKPVALTGLAAEMSTLQSHTIKSVADEMML